MFSPKYTITPKLLGNIKRITLLIHSLNKKTFQNIVLVEMEREARTSAVRNSLIIFNIGIAYKNTKARSTGPALC